MNPNANIAVNGAAPGWAVGVVLVSMLLLLARLMGLGEPIVFSDEYSYGAWTWALAEGTPVSPLAPRLDNWLFLRIFELAHHGNTDFIVVGRVINALLFSLAAGAIYRWLAPTAGWRVAAVLAISYAVLFGGALAGYFMPEAGLAAMTALLALAFMRYAAEPGIPGLLLVALAGVAASLMKTHGTLLLPAFALATLLLPRKETGPAGWRIGGAHAALVIVAWLLGMTLVRGLLGGGWSLNPLGAFYTDVANDSASRLGSALSSYLVVAKAHAAYAMLVAGVPVLLAVLSALRGLVRRSEGHRAIDAVNLALVCALAGMVLVSIMYTVSEAGQRPHETLTRIHGRYYEHLLLLAAIGGAVAAPGLLAARGAVRWGVLAVGGVMVLLAYAGSDGLGWQFPNDYSAAYAVQASPVGRYYGAAIALLALVAAVALPRRAHQALALGLATWLAFNAVVTEKLRMNLEPQAGDRAAEMVAEAESDGDRARVLVVSSGYSVSLYRVAIHLMDEDVTFRVGQAEACDLAAQDARWVIVLDEGSGTCGLEPVAAFDEITVARTKDQP